MKTVDCIVLGVGGVGSAALYSLARRGINALGLDRFPIAHDRGSSHGDTRVIRQAYFEHPDYVPLLQRSYELWTDLEQQCGRKLYHECGLLEIGPPNGSVVPGVLSSADTHQLPVEALTKPEVYARFPGYTVPDGSVAVFEQNAGYLMVEQCVESFLEQAAILGADIDTDNPVISWQKQGGSLLVKTAKGDYSTNALIVTAGAWARELLADLEVDLKVVRKPLFWMTCQDSRYFADQGAPTFFYELVGERGATSFFYGFPGNPNQGVKVAVHSGGQEVQDPLSVDRSQHPADLEEIRSCVKRCLPSLGDKVIRHTVCMYTKTPDEHFIVDSHPSNPKVVLAAGLSGHGYKFASVLGEVLADMAVEGGTKAPVDFLRLARFL